jgi:anti-sigma factor RsiW
MNDIPANGPCEDYEFEVADLVDGTLAPEKARIVRLHVAACVRCRRWRDEYAAVDRRLAGVLSQAHADLRLPADFEWKLRSRLQSLTRGAARPDSRTAAEREYAAAIAGLRRRLRSATLAGAASAAAVIGCALAVLPTLIERLRSTADALNVQDSSPMYGVATLVLVAGVLIWSGRNGALSP